MPHKHPRSATVAFKADEGLAALLNGLPNKSAFIREAIAARLGICCPLCMGKGVLPRGLHDHYVALLNARHFHACDDCGVDVPLPKDPGDLEQKDRGRLEQFFLGGPLYCAPCDRDVPSCGKCDWHVGRDRISDHVRLVHSEGT